MIQLKKRVPLIIGLVILTVLVLFVLMNSGEKNQAEKEAFEFEQLVDKGMNQEAKSEESTISDEEIERLKYDNMFVDADETVVNYIIAKVDGHNPDLLNLMLKNSQAYNEFTASTKTDYILEEGKFDKSVYFYQFTRLASDFEASGTVYYIYQALEYLPTGKTSVYEATIGLVQDANQDWKVKVTGRGVPNGVLNKGATVTNKKHILNQSLYDSYPFK